MSSDFPLTLPQLLARHRRQMVLLVIRDLAFPHDEDDLQPFGAQRPERLAVRVSPRALLIVVRAGPLTREQREERHVIDHVPQRLVTRVAELDDPLLLAASLRHRDGAGLRLQMAKRLPSPCRPSLREASRTLSLVGSLLHQLPFGESGRRPTGYPFKRRGTHVLLAVSVRRWDGLTLQELSEQPQARAFDQRGTLKSYE